MKISTGLRNAMLSTGSIKSVMDGGELRVYSGTPPASADDAVTGTLLVTIKAGGAAINFAAAAAGGILAKASGETWSGVNAATGTAAYFRHVKAADAGALSTTDVRIQGTIATAGADMNWSSVGLTSGATQSVTGYNVTLPAAS